MTGVITQQGGTKYSFGLANIVQHIKNAIGTPRGTLLRHPAFGFPLFVGQSLADLDINSLSQGISNLFNGDPTYTSVSDVTVLQQGPISQITATIGIGSIGLLLPVTVNLTSR
ncbi:MAG: hypothetical protein KGO96_07745 [Elusimicrobia bacterium]|nr:hypothetical protein [Elusimicrobiota bacterium]